MRAVLAAIVLAGCSATSLPSQEPARAAPKVTTAATQACVPPQTTFDPFNGGIATQEVCRDDRWCWENAPVGSPMLSLFPIAENDIWAVGGIGATMHWDGALWSFVPAPTDQALYTVWGAATDDVWAAGSGAMLHWDGAAWSQVALPPGVDVSALSGTSATDIWGISNVKPQATAVHWDGTAWTPVPLVRAPSAIFAVTASDAVIADATGCQRWNGAAWADEACGVPGGTSVWASASDDVWVLGRTDCGDYCMPTSRRSHWNGTAWTVEETRDQYWQAVFGYAPNDVWINGSYHYDGQTWTQVTACFLPASGRVDGATPGTLWAADYDGIKHFDGTAWSYSAMTHPWYPAILGGPAGDTFVADALGKVVQFDGTSWNTLRSSSVQTYAMAYEGFGSSSSDIWGYDGDHKLWHFDGVNWTLDGTGRVLAGWSRSPTDAIASSETPGKGWHYDGTSWTPLGPIFANDQLTNFWGSAPNDVWTTGFRGSYPDYRAPVWHWDGNAWSELLVDQGGYGYNLFGTAANDVYIAANSHVLHYDGAAFSELLRDVRGVAGGGSGPDDVWLAGADVTPSGNRAFLRHWNGATLSEGRTLPMAVNKYWGIPGLGTVATSYTGGVWLQRR